MSQGQIDAIDFLKKRKEKIMTWPQEVQALLAEAQADLPQAVADVQQALAFLNSIISLWPGSNAAKKAEAIKANLPKEAGK